MVVIDHERNFAATTGWTWPAVNWVIVGAMAGGTALVSILVTAHYGLNFGAELIWRFAAVPFLIAMAAGPLGRISGRLSFLRDYRRDLWLGFCASEAIYLTVLAAPAAIQGVNLPLETIEFVILSMASTVGILAATGPVSATLNGWPRRTLLDGAMVYFWLCYSAAALDHLYGPHRPDRYYGICLVAMLAVLLLRFAGCVMSASRTGAQAAGRPRLQIPT